MANKQKLNEQKWIDAMHSTKEQVLKSKNNYSGLFLIHSLTDAGSPSEKAWAHGNFLASNRIQLDPARKAAEAIGISTHATNLRAENMGAILNLPKINFCIIGKLSHPSASYSSNIAIGNLAAIALLKAKQTKLIVTYSDNLAITKNEAISKLYKALLWHADSIVYPSRAMTNHGRPWYNPENRPLEWIIEDPWQVKETQFKSLTKGEACRIIWFGHSTNAIYLHRELKNIFETTTGWENFELTILGDAKTAQEAKNILRDSISLAQWKIRFQAWSATMQPEQLQKELSRAHLSIIPSDPLDPRKSAASHNRAVDSIQGGCMTIASPIESYYELKKVMLITSNFGETIKDGVYQHERLIKKWESMREKELARFNPEVIAAKWQELIRYHCGISTEPKPAFHSIIGSGFPI